MRWEPKESRSASEVVVAVDEEGHDGSDERGRRIPTMPRSGPNQPFVDQPSLW